MKKVSVVKHQTCLGSLEMVVRSVNENKRKRVNFGIESKLDYPESLGSLKENAYNFPGSGFWIPQGWDVSGDTWKNVCEQIGSVLAAQEIWASYKKSQIRRFKRDVSPFETIEERTERNKKAFRAKLIRQGWKERKVFCRPEMAEHSEAVLSAWNNSLKWCRIFIRNHEDDGEWIEGFPQGSSWRFERAGEFLDLYVNSSYVGSVDRA